MPVPVQSPEPAEQLERRYAYKGALRMFLDEVIVPVEVIRPRRRKFVLGSASPAAAIGFRSEVVLVNTLPFSQGILDDRIEVHKIWVDVPAAAATIQIIRPSAGIAGFTNRTSKAFVELALGTAPTGAIQDDNTAVATVGTQLWRQSVLTDEPFEIDLFKSPWVLSGTASNVLLIRPATDNIAINVSILWSEPPDPA